MKKEVKAHAVKPIISEVVESCEAPKVGIRKSLNKGATTKVSRTGVSGGRETPKFEIDKSLNKFQGEILFKSTIGKAREAFANLRLPKNTKVRS
jgi:hypothetical protein